MKTPHMSPPSWILTCIAPWSTAGTVCVDTFKRKNCISTTSTATSDTETLVA